MTHPIAAELVWYISVETEPYDARVFAAMAAEFGLADALAGRPWAGLWIPERHLEHRWEPFERACLALLGRAPD